MSGKTILGILLIVLGALAIAYRGFTYTTQKKEVDIGSLEINKKEHHEVDFPPLLGALAVVGGVAVLVLDRRRK